jgi:hypothetical protein
MRDAAAQQQLVMHRSGLAGGMMLWTSKMLWLMPTWHIECVMTD